MTRKFNLKNLNIEKKIQDDIENHIDNKESFVFDAVAGSGKTYSLIETLRYIINNKSDNFNALNKNVLVITYTNAAKNEIISRLGLSDIIVVGTIHEVFWDFVKDFSDELKEIHGKKIHSKNMEYNNTLDGKFDNYKEYIKYLGYPDNMKDYYNNLSPVKKLRGYLENITEIPSSEYEKSGKNFTDKVSATINLIRNEQIDYSNNEVVYNSRLSRDRLHYLEISHDTVIDYIAEIFNQYKQLRNMFKNKFPIVLIDEYQDTNIKIYNTLIKIKFENNDFTIGMFGDKMQKLYDQGINNYDESFKGVKKNYNRRSSNSVIKLASKISGRDEISIYKDNIEGEVSYYNDIVISDLIIKLKKEWNINKENKLQVLTLKNENLAKHLGFPNFYMIFKISEEYRGANFRNLIPETISSNEQELGFIQSLIFRIIKLFSKLSSPYLFLNELSFDYSNVNQSELKSLRITLNNIKFDKVKNIKDFTDLLTNKNIFENKLIMKMLEKELIISDKIDKETSLFETISNEINEHASKFNIDDNIFQTEKLLTLKIEELINWFDYIIGKDKEQVNYDTLHGSKGKEYKNVLVILEDDFAIKNYFKNAIDMIVKKTQISEDRSLNLLYVASTRAIDKLAILYEGTINNENYKSIIEKL